MRRPIAIAVAGVAIVLLTGTSAADQPFINNSCSTAPAVPGCAATVPLRFQTPYTEDYERRPSCAGNFAYYNSVWVKFVAESTGVTIDTCAASNALLDDSLISVYQVLNPGTPCTSLVEIACLDDTPGCGDDEWSPRIEALPVTPGEAYYIQVGVFGYGGGACGGASPCTNGDYTLSITCVQPQPCLLQYPDAPREDELESCSDDTRINEGCSRTPVAISSVRIGDLRLGNGYAESNDDLDQDWYRFVVPGSVPVDVTLWAQSQFAAIADLLRVGADLCDTTPELLAPIPDCQPWLPIATRPLAPGVYYLVIKPDMCSGQVPCHFYRSEYLFSLVTTPLVTPTGACCTTNACVELSESDCAGLAGIHLGDGTLCAAASCYDCPVDALLENEPLPCPAHGYVDETNAGCDGVTPLGLQFTDISSGQTWCGSTGTFFDVPPPNATSNRRDTDWYRMALTGVTPQQWRRLGLSIWSESALEVLVYNPDLATTCPDINQGFRLVLSTRVEPGRLTMLAPCVQKRLSLSGPLGDVLIVIRPVSTGTPRELPCGRRYRFTATLEPCTVPGACCVTSTGGVAQGCQMLTALQCFIVGGQFAGEGAACSEFCCPCPTGASPEYETTCGDPNDTVNGGCNSPGFGYPFSARLGYAGASVCGTTRNSGFARDTDWYAYNHPGGDIVYTIKSDDYAPLAFIIEPGPGADPDTQCAESITLASGVGAPCTQLVLVAPAQPAGVYWLWAGAAFDTSVACGGAYFATVHAVDWNSVGACCFGAVDPNIHGGFAGCAVLTQSECIGNYGAWGGAGTDCDPNPCPGCPVVCSPDAVPEGEPLCNTGPIINGGCDTGDNHFSPLLTASGAAVCGTTHWPASGAADTDWYDYAHAGGDLVWAIRAEFLGRVRVVGPVHNELNPCCGFYEQREYDFSASCTTAFAAVHSAPAGRYFIVIAPRPGNGAIACGAKYELRVSSGSAGACCSDSGCTESHQSVCVSEGGIWRGSGTSCQSGTCYCKGDLDCDGDVDFLDIDPFVAALNPDATPNCPRLNADCDNDGDVDFFDIDPFVTRLGTNCD